MHTHTVDERISPVSWAHRHHGVEKYADEGTRRHWRKIWKRNGGRKVKSTKRVGK